MAFDISRNTFNAWNDYLGVLMQQGRVHLDSDWNELLAEFTRRIQAGALDVVGLSGVPSTTPGAFQISVSVDSSGNPHLGIGPGRMYVDGVLAENHGSSSAVQWDPTLGDLTGSALDYSAQPYVLGAALPASGSGSGHYLVYLDVWQREVSYLQDPDLVDPAVGIDTTGRLQTVWQVKLLDIGAFTGPFAGSTPDAALWNATTATPAGIAAGPMWQTLIQGSPSLLSSGAAQGYTGQENQLYRVEIHQGGSPATTSSLPVSLPFPAGTATFKWSRENASVAAGVTAITLGTNSLAQPASQLIVTSLGRDQVLGFTVGDWVEITDDFLELNGTSSALGSASSTQCGELHYIDSINTAALTVTLDSPVSTVNFPLTNGFTDPSRHTRMRRWDQSGTVYLADGQTPYANLQSANTAGAQPALLGNAGIPVPPPGTSLILENGITVAFDLSTVGSGAFQTGDYWTLAARSADGSVTALSTAPPEGIGHHLCRLAIVDFTATPPAVVSDCRTVFQSLANPSIQVTNVAPVSGTQLQSGGTLSVQNLIQGINIYFNSPIAQAVIGSANPICYITVQIPDSGGGWLTQAILQGTVTSTATTGIPWSITWTPGANVETALLAQVSSTTSVAACLTLKGDGIYADGGPPFIYLNGSPVADGRAYADFNLWFSINSEPPVTLSAQSLTFPTPIIVGNSSTALPVTLANNTGGQVTFPGTGIAVTGPNAADFTINSNTCGTGVGGNSTCAMGIVFTPTSIAPFTATRSATLSVQESIDANPLTVTLTGTALAPWLLATPSGVSFPATVVGQTSTLTVTLSNSGTAALSISTITISGTPPAAPAIRAASPALATVKVTDIIKAVEIKTLEVKTFDTKALEVKVTDKIAEKVTDIIVIPPTSTAAPGDFTQSSNCVPPGGGTLQPGQACTITVNFTPSATGVRIAYLLISHNAAGSLNSIPLSGSGILSTKLQEVKITDRVVVGTTKLSDQIKLSAKIEPATAPAASTTESSTLKSFITPEERPAVAAPDKPTSG